MLSALSHSSLANPSSDLRSSPTTKSVKTEQQDNDNNPNEPEQDREGSAYEDNMDYNADDTPVHPLAPAPSSNYSSSSSFPQGPHPGPQQHQQLLKLKTEHGVSSFTASNTPDITMSEEHDEACNMENESSTEEESRQFQVSGGTKAHLMVDTTCSEHSLSRRDSMLTPMTGTPSTDTPSAPSSGRRPSLRTMTTLPRSALQEETIALFKQYRDLIPCAKCFSRKTIQRDGMSDGNLRFKCRPPVSMNLICNKSYSESKIRNMIAGVVYGNSLPESGTPTSGGPGSDNVLAMAPPPTKGSRRSSHVDGSPSIGPEMTPDMDARDRDQLEDYSEMDRDDMSPGADQTDDGLQVSRRPSIQQIRRGSMAGEDSMSMEYDPSGISHPNYLQVPGTPPMDNGDPRLHRPRSAHGDNPRSVTPTGLSHATSPVPPRSNQKLRHSHSQPNIGQQRQHPQHPMDPQDRLKEHRGSLGNISYPTATQPYPHHQQRQLQRQVLRRESTQQHGVRQHRPEPERRSSHPAILPSSSTSKYLPVGSIHEAHSPIMSSSSPRASPGRDLAQQDHRAIDYHRRMSQPHHSYGSLPPPHPSPLSNHYDRRAIEAEEYHREKYDKMAHLQPGARYPAKSPRLSHALPDGEEDARAMAPMRSHGSSHWMPSEGPNYAPQGEPMRYSHSLPLGGPHRPQLRQQASSSSLYYSQPRRDEPESPQSEGRDLSPDYGDDDRPRLGVKRKSLGNLISRSSSSQNLYGTTTTTAATTTTRDLSSALPKSSIKLTCFPGTTTPAPSTKTLHSTDALAMQLHQSSKLVIEISQPMISQAYPPMPQSLARSSSQPNLLMRSSSILSQRRSASPLDDKQDYSSSNKRRAVSVSGKEGDEEASEPSAAEAAAAAVVAAAAAASGSISASEKTSMGGLQIIGVDYNKSGPTKGLGLLMDTATPTYVLSGADTSSPSIEALGVARASSYAAVEDQKELGIDYSLFTRVETAGWRILIPPNVTASFQSDDFGLVLKPKCPPSDVTLGGAEEDAQSGSRRSSDGGQSVEDSASDEIKKSFSNIALDDLKGSEKDDLEMDEKAKRGALSDEKKEEEEEEKEPVVQEEQGEDVDMDELEDE
ncbi:hypothetical protein BGZ59_003316 [Podila verticillata]|nr:hypothetical protein BGZ59_003316 [Podila verticillata]KFH63603.1 hypothetical protein MVEG_10297 [Podila verticillata NRRL 6337]